MASIVNFARINIGPLPTAISTLVTCLFDHYTTQQAAKYLPLKILEGMEVDLTDVLSASLVTTH